MLKRVSTLALSVLLASVAAVFAQSTTHTVLTNDQDFLVSNDRFLSGVYECSDGGYIDFSCITGHLPEVNCPDGYAIQTIGAALSPVGCIAVGGGSGTPAGSDTYVQYNAMGVFGADLNFTWNYTSSILTLGGGGPGTITLSGAALASLGTPSDGSIEYCTDCTIFTNPCTTGGTGAFAQRLNGAWSCGNSSSISGTNNTVVKFTSSTTIGDSGITDNGTTVTVASEAVTITAGAFTYGGALNITNFRAMSSDISANSTDRIILCTSGSSTDKTYTMPAATGTGRTIDLIKVDSGTNACKLTRASSDAINSGTTATLSSQWNAETCVDIGSAQWACRGVGSIS